MTDFIFLGSRIIAYGDCNHEIKSCLLLGRKAMTNLDSILKRRDVTLPPKVYLVKAMAFSSSHVWMWELNHKESWVLKNCDAFELWCWRRLLRVPWTARKSNQSTLKEVNPEYSLMWLMGILGEVELKRDQTPRNKLWICVGKMKLVHVGYFLYNLDTY